MITRAGLIGYAVGVLLLTGSTLAMLVVGDPRLGRFAGWPVVVASVGLCVALSVALLVERLWLQNHPERWGGVSVTGAVVGVGLVANLVLVLVSFVSTDSPNWHAVPLVLYGLGGILVGALGDYPPGGD